MMLLSLELAVPVTAHDTLQLLDYLSTLLHLLIV